MASRIYANTQALDKEVKFLSGIVPLGADAAVGTVTMLGATVAKTATGTYRITLDDKYPELLSAHFSKFEAAATNLRPEGKAHDVSGSTPYVDFVTVDYDGSAAVADVAAALNVHVTLVLKNSTVSP